MINEYSSDIEKYIYSCFKDLRFEERRHLYNVDIEGKVVYLPSVSSFVNKFSPKFNENKKVGYQNKTLLELSANKASRERGEVITTTQLKAEWIKKNVDACKLGTDTHNFLEHYTGIQTPTIGQEKAGIGYIKSLKDRYRISFRELRAYSKEFLYAGTMDLPLEVIEGNTFEVADYKTNGDLFKAYDYLYAPFENLDSSPYNKYQIQLSYYQIMLEEVGLTVTNRRLVHLREDATFKVYDLEDLTGILRDYMKHNIK